MRAVIISDFLILRDSLGPSIIAFVIIGLVMALGMGSAVGSAACIAAMSALAPAITLMATDETNGWERFRAVLPVSRQGVVCGRYASVAVAALAGSLFACVLMLVLKLVVVMPPILWIMKPFGGMEAASAIAAEPILTVCASAFMGGAISLLVMIVQFPLIARFGMTRAIRFAPFMFALVALLLFGAAESALFESSWFLAMERWLASEPGFAFSLTACVVVAVVLVLYAASAVLSTKFYEAREF